MLRITILSFDGCPHRELALERTRAAIAAEDAIATVAEEFVEDAAAAYVSRFLGSPSVRVEGIDVERSARASDRFGFMCRTYRTEHDTEGAPSIDMIRAALRESSATRG